MHYRRKITESERTTMQCERFHEMWDAGKRAEALAYRDTLGSAARRAIDDEAQARSERACHV